MSRSDHSFNILDPKNWKSLEREEMLAWIERLQNKLPRVGPPGVEWTLSKRIKPVLLYSYLKLRFGEPNGLAMMFRNDSVDNLIHWNYTVISGPCFIDLFCLDSRLTIRLSEQPSEVVEFLEEAFLNEFKRCNAEIDRTKRGFEKWHLFVNPFCRLKRIVDQQESRLRAINIGGMAVPDVGEAIQDGDFFQRRMREITDACDEAMAISVTLEMMAPVLGESLVNFLILLLARPEIRNDKRMLESYTRNSIDVRIKSLPLVCVGFKRSIDTGADEFKDFLRLMDNRNKRLHGSIDPTVKTGDEIYFDHSTIPLFENQRSLPDFAVHAALAHADPSSALGDLEVARNFITFALDHLNEGVRSQVQLILQTSQLGYRPDKKRIGIILPASHVDIIHDPNKPNHKDPEQ